MFERRLRIVLLIPCVYAIVLVVRLFNLQIVQGDAYQQQADDALVSPKKFLPPLRGRILDRFGRPLVSDAPANDVAVHYGVLSLNESYLQQAASNLRRNDAAWKRATLAEAEEEIRERIGRMWVTLEKASGTPLRRMKKRRDAICDRIESLRRHIWNARRAQGSDDPLHKTRLREESQYHSILRDIPPEVRTQLEVELAGMPFVRIEPSVRRIWNLDAQPLSHALGTLGQVSADRMARDPLTDDWLGCYRPGDEAGASGIEYLCEDMLRGKRGYEEKYLDGRIKSSQPPKDGLDIQLTVDLKLQSRIHQILDEAISADPYVTGAACVVIDVNTREILALASAPTFSAEGVRKHYDQLRDDARYRPLLFRAVAEEYQPGSIIKPVLLLGAFKNKVIDPRQTVHCDGSYVPGSSNWHCWTHWKHLPGHGNLNAEEAIQHSCNIFFYTLGDRLGAARVSQFYRDFILGPADLDTNQAANSRRSITGLLEERSGIIPTLDYLRSRQKRDFRPADGRNYAIGQGELQLTPLQAANMYATLASGQYRDPTLVANDGTYRPPTPIDGLTPQAWRTVRNGLFRCVNDPGGTAYKHARLDELEICGKTGSAQCVARAIETRYSFNVDGRIQSAVAPTIEKAREMLDLSRKTPCVKREVLKRWPPNREGKDEPQTHAWFAGFAPYDKPEIALAVILEHGGGGGQAAGPIGKEIFRLLIDFGYLRPGRTLASTDIRP
ncbi:MAG: hypothetical protein KF841_15655 [Phycisphaerae bacterium]|nr:hypothetical protein [Phycisphaerae bacterium]